MKLYRVQTYEEIYFKSLYKPLFYDPIAEKDKTYEKDPAAFVAPIIDLAGFDDGLWLYWGENEQLFLAEVARNLGSAPKIVADRYLLLWRKWYEIGPRTPELHQEIVKAGHEVWKYAQRAAKDAYNAQRFWEQVRSQPIWQGLYDKIWNGMRAPLREALGPQFARDGADYYCRQFLQGKISAAEVRKALDHPTISDYIGKALAWIAALGGIILAQAALLGLAAGCIITLIWNPHEWGRKVTHYYEGRHLMVFDEYLWWADLIGRTPKAHYYYRTCAELHAKILTHEYWLLPPWTTVDTFNLTTWPVPIEQIDEWYWLLWPTKIKAVFVGTCTRRNDRVLTINQSFSKNELPPTEPYLDAQDVLRYRRPKWWTEKEGEGCMRPAKDWCKEYYHWEEIIPS